jgi:hypothetical protein
MWCPFDLLPLADLDEKERLPRSDRPWLHRQANLGYFCRLSELFEETFNQALHQFTPKGWRRPGMRAGPFREDSFGHSVNHSTPELVKNLSSCRAGNTRSASRGASAREIRLQLPLEILIGLARSDIPSFPWYRSDILGHALGHAALCIF